MKKLLHYYLSAAMLLCSLAQTRAQGEDTYRWVEKDGVYTLAGTPKKGDIATIKVGVYYSAPENGANTIWFTVSGIDPATDAITAFYPVERNGRVSDTQHALRVTEGWNDVILTATHKGSGKVSGVAISDLKMPTNTTHPIETLSNIFDINDDGKMEFLRSRSEGESVYYEEYNFFCTYDYPGLIPGDYPKLPDGGQARLCNLNNDGIPDVRYLEGGGVALSQNGPAWQVPARVTEAPYPCDYNNDGRTDLMQSTHKVFRQGADGSFNATEIIPVTSEEDTLVYNRWQASHTNQGIGMGNLGGDVGVPIGGEEKIATFNSNREFYSMDFNQDGHEDLIDETTGTILLNRGNNRFLKAPQSGRLYMRDLNGDFIADYICYDEDTRTVESMVFQKDGSMKKQTLMSNLAMDRKIYFYDFNNDGAVDVLLPFSASQSTGEYSYLVLAINDGKGNFSINEDNTYRRKLHFVGCADVDSDGHYDILALEPDPGRPTWNGHECDLYWLKGNGKLGFEEMHGGLINTTLNAYEYSNEMEGDAEAFTGDFDNDGICDVLVHSIVNNGSGKYEPTPSFLYTFTKETATPNRAPQKPATPTWVADEASGMLQVNWQKGTDDLTPQADLTYALRIGTEPGKGDVVYAAANADGRRLNLMPGNMEYNLGKKLNVAGWKTGDYYIAVQSIDAMCKGSAWSDEVVYRHNMLQAPIYIPFKDVSTADTVTLAYDGTPNPQHTYHWELDGGIITEEEAGGSTVRVIYHTPGQKNIALRVSDAGGNTGTPQTADLSVRAARIDEKEQTEWLGWKVNGVADMDNNGTPELLTENGVYQQISGQDLEFEKAPGIYNTNLSINLTFPWDYNRDGMVDFIGGCNYDPNPKKYAHNLLLNQGNKRFAVSKTVSEIFEPRNGYMGSMWFDTPIYDFNNDGQPDYYIRENGNDTIYENTGDWNTFIAHPVEMSFEEFYDYDFEFADINGDNLIDMICPTRIDNVYPNQYKIVLFINRGNFEFQRAETNVFTMSQYVDDISFLDLNNDGIKDFIEHQDKELYYIYLSQNGQYNYDRVAIYDIPSKPLCYDLDNNGYTDLISQTLDRVFYNYGDGKFELKTAPTNGKLYRLLGNTPKGKLAFIEETGAYTAVAESRIANTTPQVPTGIRAVQDAEGYLTISWNAAEDAETPPVQMRYNLSVKKQGATGEGAFVISPLNALSNDAAPIPDRERYLTGTQYRIPVSALEIGSYEISMQSIDGQLTTSAFSQPVTVEILPKPLLALPARICQDKAATIRYIGTGGKQITVDFGADAEVLDSGSDHTYEVVWSTQGYKDITVTVDGTSSRMQAYVNEPIDASFTLPEITLSQTNTYFEVSDDILMNNRQVKFTVKALGEEKDFSNPTEYGISFERKKDTKEVRARFENTGSYIVRMTVSDEGCGEVFGERTVEVLESMGAPDISLVTVDPATGKNRINWKFTNLPDYITTVGVYKEGAHYNKFELLEEVDPQAEGYTDMSSNPAITTARYRICLNTSFGIPTESGTPHQSVHLTINRGMNGSWNLIWNAYVGRDIDNYRILRGTTPDNLAEIARVAGSATSYTDVNAPEGVVYYAIAYDAYYEDEWQPMTRAMALISAQSNTVSAAQAQNLRLAEELYIRHLEKEAVLHEDQPELHLYTDIYPVSASCKNVNWTIVKGEDLAYITPQGLLTAHGDNTGEIVVRATTIDGTQFYKDITVIRKSIVVPVESISIIPYEDIYMDYTTGTTRVALQTYIYPENATDKEVTWQVTEGSQIAYVDESMPGYCFLTGTGNGEGVVEVSSKANPEIKDSRRFYINGLPSSIDTEEADKMNIYPTRVTGKIHIMNMPQNGEKQIFVIDTSGRCRHTEQTAGTEATIECGSYTPGLYLLKIVTESKTLTRKFIKTKP